MSTPSVRRRARPRALLATLLAIVLPGCAGREAMLSPEESTAAVPSPRGAADLSAAPTYRVLPFDVPATMGDFTSVFGINDFGTLTGNFQSTDGCAHGFVFRFGRFTDVVVSGAGPADKGSLGDVNELGTAIGGFTDASDVAHMYLRDWRGRITLLPDPLPGALGADATGINNHGTVVGTVFDASGEQHGFIYTRGQFTFYDQPGGSRTRLFSVNNRGEIAGQWFDAGNTRHGFVLDHGRVTPVDVPGAVGTAATGINDRGQIVGFYRDSDGVTHGFLLDHGRFTTIDFPGSADTRLTAINNLGVIVGTYDFFSRGMVALPFGENHASSVSSATSNLIAALEALPPAPAREGARAASRETLKARGPARSW